MSREPRLWFALVVALQAATLIAALHAWVFR